MQCVSKDMYGLAPYHSAAEGLHSCALQSKQRGVGGFKEIHLFLGFQRGTHTLVKNVYFKMNFGHAIQFHSWSGPSLQEG